VTRNILFRINFPYDERQVEDVLEDLEQAGAYYEVLEGVPGGFELKVPDDADYEFCHQTLLQCPSLAGVREVIQDHIFSESGD